MLDQKDCVQITSSYRKRKVTFSESVYRSATEIALTERKFGMFSTVANAFQAAFTCIPGIVKFT